MNRSYQQFKKENKRQIKYKQCQLFSGRDTIDYSSFWGDYNSIKILNTGKAYIYYKDFMDNAFYYSVSLDNNQLDSLSKMVKSLYNIKLDSAYILPRDSGRDFSLVINSENNRLATIYSGPITYGGLGGDGLKPLYSFVDHLIQLSENLRKSIDSSFVFESKVKLKMILPSPPMIE